MAPLIALLPSLLGMLQKKPAQAQAPARPQYDQTPPAPAGTDPGFKPWGKDDLDALKNPEDDKLAATYPAGGAVGY